MPRPRTLLPFVLACASAMVANAAAQTPAPDPTLPPNQPPVLLHLLGRGVQIYTCKLTGSSPAWTFTAPEAMLEDRTGAVVGAHSAGPTWTLKDGSSVHGRTAAQTPSPIKTSVPWLLLQATQSGGPGALSTVTYIRRSDTSGGAAPTSGCDPVHLGAVTRVPYTATYTFYGPTAPETPSPR